MPIIIAVDFDGTIAEHEFPDIGKAVPGAFRWMKAWQKAGARLILWTMRSDARIDKERDYLAAAVGFCLEHGVEFWGHNENPEQGEWTKSPKVYANLYVDDAAYGCPLRESNRAGGRPMVAWDVVGPSVLRIIEEAKS